MFTTMAFSSNIYFWLYILKKKNASDSFEMKQDSILK